jgi:serine protease
MRPALVGLSLATAACLLFEALVPTAAWGFGVPLLAGPWLIVQAGAVVWLARAVARPR